jgi:hypothetical protein
MARVREGGQKPRAIFEPSKAVMFSGYSGGRYHQYIGPDFHGKAKLVESIHATSDNLRSQLSRFLNIVHRFKLLSFYEPRGTRMLVRVRMKYPTRCIEMSCLCSDSYRIPMVLSVARATNPLPRLSFIAPSAF